MVATQPHISFPQICNTKSQLDYFAIKSSSYGTILSSFITIYSVCVCISNLLFKQMFLFDDKIEKLTTNEFGFGWWCVCCSFLRETTFVVNRNKSICTIQFSVFMSE